MTALPRAPLALSVLLLAAPAVAGDFATPEPIGFSPDGRVFAFEQHGIRDGSGFPYAEIFFVDLAEDAFVEAPVRVSLESDDATLAEARAEARRQAADLFAEYRPEEDPGTVVAANPPTETSADPHRVAFRPRPFEPWPDEPVELTIELKPLEGPDYCADAGGGQSPRGFDLALRPAEGSARAIYEDRVLPTSRGCAYDYQISQVIVGGIARDELAAVALVGVKSVGFEGPDLRYVAVPVPLP